MNRFAIRSSKIVTPDGIVDGTVVVEAGRIVEVLDGLPEQRLGNTLVVDVGQLTVMPGLVDTHVHVNEPGRTDWEGFETATRAAASGGITTIVDMPLNSSPVTTTAAALETKIAAASGKLHVDCGFHGGVVPGCLPDLPALLEGGVLGMKAFMVDSGLDDFPATPTDELLAASGIIAAAGIPLLAHAERIESPTTKSSIDTDAKITNYEQYEQTRPRRWEERAIDELIALSSQTGCKIHVVHLASPTALAALAAARQRGLPITVETCPHYLYFDADSIPDGSTVHKCAPPIRSVKDANELWAGLIRGEIDIVASDHSPCPPDMKLDARGNLAAAWGGISSLELGGSIVWTLAQRKDMHANALVDMARWMSLNPSKLVGLDTRKGSIEPGKDADLAIWDFQNSFVVDPRTMHQRHKLTPYAGHTLTGRVQKTYVRGKVAFDAQGFPKPVGGILRRHS